MITIDGSRGEGGGQLLRTSVALPALTGKPCRIINIRANRPNPGLREQHLQGILAVAKFCGGRVKNAELGATQIEFYPNNEFAEEIVVDIKTAGAITLVLQSLMIPSAFANKNFTIKINGGATNTAWSPAIDYTSNVFIPLLSKLGYNAGLRIIERGFYPRGGAEVECKVNPVKALKNLVLEKRGGVKLIKGISMCANLPAHIATRQRTSAESLLKSSGYEVVITEENVASLSAGSSVVLWAECDNTVIGADALGDITQKTSVSCARFATQTFETSADKVGSLAAANMLKTLESGFALDQHAADQIIPYIALAKGRSVVTTNEITNHTLANIGISEEFLGVEFETGKNSISVDGCSFGR
ncbi:MAG: RNA 3'-terminal phosphate cyclase [Candidatus Aenigmatarchaeota archaeon]